METTSSWGSPAGAASAAGASSPAAAGASAAGAPVGAGATQAVTSRPTRVTRVRIRENLRILPPFCAVEEGVLDGWKAACIDPL
uniref:Uncharacterized protein n=1 Tax=Litorilinea aerophila TaxID=1204385 RepID=A0A540VJB4_9CHLR